MPPTPTHDTTIPPTMRVAVDIGYVRGCAKCERIVSEMATLCIMDASCTSFRSTPGRRHAHEVTDGPQALPGLSGAPTGAPGAAQAIENEDDLPISDVNGYHPDLVTIASDGLNGFDAP